MPLAVYREHHLLVLDVNGLLCEAIQLKSRKLWHPLDPPHRCGNKLVSLCLNSQQFLELCSSKFDIAIWSLTILPNFKPMVDLLLRGLLRFKPIFVLGVEKCLNTCIPHLSNKDQSLHYHKSGVQFTSLNHYGTLKVK
jgi:hypothetical protein